MTPLERALLKSLRNPELFSEHILGRPLRHYQAAPLRAILHSIQRHQGLTFTLMFARQMGKNETSGHLEAYLLNRYQHKGGTIIKAAPTLQPQAINSKIRLISLLSNPLNAADWWQREGYIGVGQARALFMSGSPEANVVGLTANLLLEVDEAQDFDIHKYSKDFRPMASTTNATTVLYGTAWTGATLLETQIAENREAERRDGIQRHFQYDWQTLAALSPDYARFVEAERQRLGEDHPLFRTQYLLQAIASQSAFINSQHQAQLQGDHARQSSPSDLGGRGAPIYVAGVDLAGADERTADEALRSNVAPHDAVVVTIAEVEHTPIAEFVQEPRLKIVEHYHWTGRKHRDLYPTLVDVLRNVWHCSRVVVDATGIGATVASFLANALGQHIVEQFTFTAPSKSALGYDLLAAINAGRLKVYSQNADQTTINEFWRQMRASRYETRANQLLTFYVPDGEGHDDFLMSLALVNRAGAGLLITPAAATAHAQPFYQDGRY